MVSKAQRKRAYPLISTADIVAHIYLDAADGSHSKQTRHVFLTKSQAVQAPIIRSEYHGPRDGQSNHTPRV